MPNSDIRHYKIIPYHRVPYGSRFRFQEKWWRISTQSLNHAEYFSGFSMIKEYFPANRMVGIDTNFTPLA